MRRSAPPLQGEHLIAAQKHGLSGSKSLALIHAAELGLFHLSAELDTLLSNR